MKIPQNREEAMLLAQDLIDKLKEIEQYIDEAVDRLKAKYGNHQ